MKTSIIFFIAMTLTLASFHTKPRDSSEQLAENVVEAFQHASLVEFTQLFPSLKEFHQIMDDHSSLYGKYIHEAKDEFAIRYNTDLVPALADAFEDVISEGKKKGIVWNSIRYSRIEIDNPVSSSFSTQTCAIVFTCHEKEYRLQIEKMFIINGQWKITQFIRLV